MYYRVRDNTSQWDNCNENSQCGVICQILYFTFELKCLVYLMYLTNLRKRLVNSTNVRLAMDSNYSVAICLSEIRTQEAQNALGSLLNGDALIHRVCQNCK